MVAQNMVGSIFNLDSKRQEKYVVNIMEGLIE